jgi:cephalosporin hydroxylase
MIDENYSTLCATPSDINEHLPLLKQYASECETVVELGVRYIVSTWALLAGRPKAMISVDIVDPKEYGADIQPVYAAADAENINFTFMKGSSLELEFPPMDLLFIDTNHTYEQLSQELKLHAPKAQKYIIMHDTNQDEFPGMVKAIEEFLEHNREWEVAEWHQHSHGLTILKRV